MRETSPGGKRHHWSRLTWAQVSEIKALALLGEKSRTQLGRDYGVDRTTILAIIRGWSWKGVPPADVCRACGALIAVSETNEPITPHRCKEAARHA